MDSFMLIVVGFALGIIALYTIDTGARINRKRRGNKRNKIREELRAELLAAGYTRSEWPLGPTTSSFHSSADVRPFTRS